MKLSDTGQTSIENTRMTMCGIKRKRCSPRINRRCHDVHGITTFPMVIREHLDSDIRIERKIVPMN